MLIILSVLLLAASVGTLIYSQRANEVDFPKSFGRGLSAALFVGALVTGFFTTFYTQTPGQANVVINLGGTVSHVDTTSGVSFKAPWQSRTTWDLLSQTATYAGSDKGAPSYTDGNIQGREVTVSLARGVQSNIDANITYSLEANEEKIRALYNQFRNQENFTKQIVQNTFLSTLREAPNGLTPSEFRGQKRAEVEGKVVTDLNEILNRYGIVVERANLQDIRFTDDVEASLRAVEVAQQREAEAEANLRATEIEAQAQVVQAEQEAEAAIARAEGQAEANRLLTESLTPEVLTQRYLDALKAGTVYVVPEGSTPLITTPNTSGK